MQIVVGNIDSYFEIGALIWENSQEHQGDNRRTEEAYHMFNKMKMKLQYDERKVKSILKNFQNSKWMNYYFNPNFIKIFLIKIKDRLAKIDISLRI